MTSLSCSHAGRTCQILLGMLAKKPLLCCTSSCLAQLSWHDREKVCGMG